MRATPRVAALWVLTLLAACAPAGTKSNPPPVTIATRPPAPAVNVPPAVVDSDAQQALDRRLHEALAFVSSVRGLAAQAEVRGRVLSRAEIRSFVAKELDEGLPPGMVASSQALLFGLGLIPADYDYRAGMLDLMSSELLGFYDPGQKTFFVGGDLSGDQSDMTLWHELVHALQDQHYDLERLTQWQEDLGDVQSAVHALAEGDATSTMLDAMLRPRGGTALDLPAAALRAESLVSAASTQAPAALVRSLIAPYVDGLVFTNFLRRQGGFAAVDAAWRDPPRSTEQVLHPQKFLDREAPLQVAIPFGAPTGYVLAYHDVMGEQAIRILFEEWMPARTAADTAAHWGGDRIAVFSDPAGDWLIGWHVRYDDEPAAYLGLISFARGAILPERVKPERLGPLVDETSARRAIKRGQVCRFRPERGPFATVRAGRDLGVVFGPFGRNPVASRTDQACKRAKSWAAQIASQ